MPLFVLKMQHKNVVFIFPAFLRNVFDARENTNQFVNEKSTNNVL